MEISYGLRKGGEKDYTLLHFSTSKSCRPRKCAVTALYYTKISVFRLGFRAVSALYYTSARFWGSEGSKVLLVHAKVGKILRFQMCSFCTLLHENERFSIEILCCFCTLLHYYTLLGVKRVKSVVTTRYYKTARLNHIEGPKV